MIKKFYWMKEGRKIEIWKLTKAKILKIDLIHLRKKHRLRENRKGTEQKRLEILKFQKI